MPLPRRYLDHAATSFPKPPEVWEAFRAVAEDLGAPAGRSAYRRALETERRVELARAALARFFGARPDRVAFTLNATDALNTALKGHLRPGDHVVTTAVEHNSVLRPLAALEHGGGVSVSHVGADAEGRIEPDDVRRALRASTRLVALCHASNVSGAIQPLAEVGRLARERGIPLLLDAAQTAGSVPIDIERDAVDFLAVPGHKGLLGPLGVGALIFSERVEVRPLREGGTGFRSEETVQPPEYPQRLEAGSPNAPGIAALGAALGWIERRGLASIREQLESLMRRFQEGLDALPRVVWHGPRPVVDREPVYCVRVEGYSPDELAALLDASFGIEVRAGLHCAPLAHRAIGTFPEGACRFSFGAMSTIEDVDAAVAALRRIAGAE
jgi:cysteine desulfurase family protein